ncbi:MAG: aldehyde ferredoxin oxidoreductase C-terminal domain-containing protein, partial [Candidatus Bathyarchaeia archaeon]
KGTVDRFKAEKGRGKIVADMEDQYVIVDSAVLCKFSRGIWKWYDDVAKLYNLVTGFDMTPEEMNLVGTRVNTLARLYNIREGLTRKDDRVPIRVMKLPIPEGVAKGSYVSQEDLDLLLDDYYEYRGWDKDGIPTEATLKELGLEEYAYLMGKEG